MKLLFFIGQLSGGGAERSLTTIVSELARRGHEVTISVNKQMMVFEPSPGVSVVYAKQDKTPTKGNGIIKSIKQFRNYLQYFPYTKKVILEVKPDVIVTFLWCNLLQILLYHKSIPVITSERNAFDRKLGFIYKVNRFLLNKHVDCVTVQTPFDKGYATAKHLKNTIIMPNPLTWEVLDETEYEARFKERRNLLACGRVDQWEIKGFDLLIKAFAMIADKYPDWVLDIAGKGSEKSIAHLTDIAKEHGLAERVHFLGFQSNVRELMINHSIFVLSSRTEGFPNVLTEAMSVGTPSISYDRLANSIVLDSVDGQLVEDQSIDGLAWAMSYLMGNEKQRYELGRNSLRNVQRFSTERIVDKWEKLFISLSHQDN